MNEERIQHFKNRITERQIDPNTVAIIVINVDAPYGGDIAEIIMPGYDWQQYRDRDEVPFARGFVMREGMIELIATFDTEAAEKISQVQGIPVIVIDHSVAEVFSV